MKVAINGRFLTQKVTGVQRYARQITTHLIKAGIDLEILVPRRSTLDLPEVFKPYVKRVGFMKGHAWEQFELPLKRDKTRVLLNFCNTAPVLDSNKYVIIHDLAFFENPKWFAFNFSAFYRFLIPKIARTSKKVGTVSQFSKDEITKFLNLSKSKVFITPNGFSHINPENFKRNGQVSKPEEVTLLTVGSIDPRKNQQVLIDAMQLLPEEFKLYIVGDRNKNFNLPNFSSQNKRVIFTGYLSDEKLKSLYRKADLFVYPSVYEGFGVPVLEAMSYGLPVIASRRASIPEVIGSAAYLVDEVKDPKSWAEAIMAKHLDKDWQKSTRLKGYSRLDNFNWPNSAKILIDELDKE